jgi:hypothetical protein
MIVHVIIKNPERVDMITQVEAAPQDINAKIMQLNQQGRLDAHTCVDASCGELLHYTRLIVFKLDRQRPTLATLSLKVRDSAKTCGH